MRSKNKERMHEKMTTALVEANKVTYELDEKVLDKTASFATRAQPSMMEKTAGILIDNPTLANCEDFIRRYMLSEMAQMPKLLEFSINIIPSSYDKGNEAFISDATGMIRITVVSKVVEVPFLIYAGELVPFDIIQMDGQRVPYTRENLVKIVSGVEHKENERAQGIGDGSPYLGVADHYNTATVPGFMGEALAIRDTHSHRQGTGSMYVTAGEYDYGFKIASFREDHRAPSKKKKEKVKVEPIVTDLDKVLSKVASIRPMTDVHYQAIADLINTKSHNDYKNRITKIAGDLPDITQTRLEKRAMERRLNKKFKPLTSFKSGDFILFPEIVNKTISLTPAIVLKTKDSIIVVANDKRYEIVKDPSKFICTKSATEFKVRTTAVDNLKEGNEFIILSGNKVEPVQTVIRINNHLKGEDMWAPTTNLNLPKKLATFIEYGPVGQRNFSKSDMFYLADIEQPAVVTNEECTELIVKANLLTSSNRPAYLGSIGARHGQKLTAVPPKMPVINLRGKISTRIDSNKQYEELSKLASTGHEIEFGIEKMAFNLNSITVKCLNPKAKIFDLAVEYKDTSERMLNKRRKDFKAISVGKLTAILYALKFDGQTINDIIYKAINEPQAKYPLPQICTQDDINNVFGGDEINASKESIKELTGKFVNPYMLAKGVAGATGAALLTGAAVNQLNKGGASAEIIKNALGFVSKIASQSEELSREFEKMAIEEESYIYKDYAKTFAIGKVFCDKVATAIEDPSNHYPSLKDAGEAIVASKPVLEKFAYDMMKEKVNGLRSNHTVKTMTLSQSPGVLDNIYKMAFEVEKVIDLSEMKFI